MSQAPTPPAPGASPPPAQVPPRALSAIAWAFMLVAGLVLISLALPLIDLSQTPRPAAVQPLPQSRIDQRKREFETRLADAASRLEGRSPFAPYIPPPPPAPTKATVYGGDRVIGVAGGAVWFDKGAGQVKRIPVGATEDGTTVLAINAPWSVTLGWGGGEFEIPILERRPVRFDADSVVKDTLFKTAPSQPPSAPPAPSAPAPAQPVPSEPSPSPAQPLPPARVGR